MITGRVLKAEESTDGRENIRIMVEFSENGLVIVPEWTLWARWENFIGRTADEISEWIRVNIEYQIGNLIKARARKDLNTEFMTAIEQMKETKVYQTDEVKLEVEPSLTITEPYTVTLKDDGTYTTDRVAVEK